MTPLLVKPADRDKALALFTTAARSANECVLRANGAAMTPASRDEMLAKCAAGEYVELELEVLSYEQQAGVANRNFTRFRDGALMALGRTGKNMPFLRDHCQNDALARGGTITESSTEKRGEGDYALRQTVKLTAPWAVELALRGLLSTVSIGWNTTGDVLCSACNAAIYTKCYHWPGDRLSMKENDAGEKKLVRDRSGDIVVEWVYTAAELVETSAVSVPAVPSAHIEAIRASLSAQSDVCPPPFEEPMNTKLLALLGLAATAGEDDIFKAVDSLVTSKKLVEQQRDELSARTVALEAKVASHAQAAAKQAEDKFIDEGVRAGKIMPASPFESALRAYHQKDAVGAIALLASSPVVTPVGQPRQSGGTQPADKTPSLAAATAKIAELGGNIDKVRKNLRSAGMTEAEIDATLAQAAGDGKAA